MDADRLASADDLWWSWAVLADSGGLPDGTNAGLDPSEHVLHYRAGRAWASMQRIGGGRAVLWGRVAGASHDAVTDHADVLSGAPDWARSDAVWHAVREAKPGFLAWYSRDGWDTSTSGMYDGVLGLILPLLAADPRLVAEARSGSTGSVLLDSAQGEALVAAQGGIRLRLRDQIHRQMRNTPDRDRHLPARPALLARWTRVTDPRRPFAHVVVVDEGALVARSDVPLAEGAALSLANVLQELHHTEAGEETGAWLVARVLFDDGRISLERRFDGLPAWLPGPGPTLRTLSWEMHQRTPAWRPAWATLLPD